MWYKQLRLDDLIDNEARTKLESEYKCERCKSRSNTSIKEYRFQYAPACLAFVLVRAIQEYEKSEGAYSTTKDLSAVRIPEELDIGRWLNPHQFGNGSHVKYRLSGLVSHSGESLSAGHYKSYVRGGPGRKKWFELDDQVVTTCAKSHFDETDVERFLEEEFKSRFVPYVVLYERDFTTDHLVPGRPPINVGEGENEDKRPTVWTGGYPRNAPTVAHFENEHQLHIFAGSEGEADKPGAQIEITVTIGHTIVTVPKCYIGTFDQEQEHDINLEAKLTVPSSTAQIVLPSTSELDVMQMDLAAAYVDAEIARREWDEKEAKLLDLRQEQNLSERDFENLRQKELTTWRRAKRQVPWSDRWKSAKKARNGALRPLQLSKIDRPRRACAKYKD